jgi:hypothetical protein
MDNFLRIGNVEVEIVSDLKDETRKSTWEIADSECKEKGLRLPTIKELEYIHNVLYLKSIGNIGEGSEYWSSESSTLPGVIGTRFETHKTYWMKYQGTESGKYNYSRMRFRGVRDI